MEGIKTKRSMKKIILLLLLVTSVISAYSQITPVKAIAFINSGDSTQYTSNPINGMIYYNHQSGKFRIYENSAWHDWGTGFGGGGSDTLYAHRYLPSVSYSSNHTIDLNDLNKMVAVNTTAGSVTITIPTNAAEGFTIGTQIPILHIDSNVTPNILTIAASGGVTITASNPSLTSPLSEAGSVFLYAYKQFTNGWHLANGSSGGGGSGTVTSASVVTANGFAGTVATPTTTPAITLSTSVTGIIKGNGTAISAAVSATDYAPATTGSSVLKASSGGFANATNADLPVMTATIGGAVPTPPNNTTTFLRGDGTFAAPSGSGDVSGPASSVDSEVAIFNSTTGKIIKRASGSGLAKLTSGVLSTITPGTGIETYITTPTWTNLLSATTGTAPYLALTGTSTATGAMTLAQGSNAFITSVTNGTTSFLGSGITQTSEASVNPQWTLAYYGSSAGFRPTFLGRRGRGTIASKLAASSGDTVFDLLADIQTGASTNETTGLYQAVVDGAVSAGVAPIRWSWYTSATNEASRAERFRISSDGKVMIGAGAASEVLQVAGNIRFSGALMPNNTAGTTGQVLTSAGAGAVPTWATPVTAGISRIINSSVTSTGNVGTGEDVLYTYTIPAGTLAVDKDQIIATASGRIAGSINNKTIKLKFGSQTIFNSGAVADAGGSDWSASVQIFRTGATTQKSIVRFSSNNTAITQECNYTTPTETLSGTVVFQVTGEATVDNEIFFDMGDVSYRPRE